MNQQPTPSKSIVTSARTTQEWTLDKAALAEWAQRTFEEMQLAYGVEKQAIEPGLCSYVFDYEKLSLLSQQIVEQAAEKGIIKGFENIDVTGSGKNVAVRLVVNIDEMFDSQYSRNLTVLGAPETSEEPNVKGGLQQVRNSLSLSPEGATLDGQMLLSGIKALADSMRSINEQMKAAKDSLPEYERNKLYNQLLNNVREQFSPMGFEVDIENGRMITTLHYDQFARYMQEHSRRDHGVVIRRNDNGTATITVDYYLMVNAAVEKASAFLAAKSEDGRNKIEHDIDSVRITLSKTGLEGIWNNLIDRASQFTVRQIAQYQGTVRDNLGTIGKPGRSS